MRTRTLTTALATTILAAITLTGCTTANSDTTAKTPNATATTDARADSGMADITGKCVKGQSTPVQNGKKITIDDCKLLDVMGSKNTITAGNIDKLVIEGSNNTITVKSTTEVTTIGNNNKVIYDGKEPTFTEHATGNTITPKTTKK